MQRRLAALLFGGLMATIAPLLSGATPATAQQAPEQVLNIYNWSDYIDPYAVQRFTQETGIRVRYDVYDSLETLEGKLSAGRSGYDIIVPTSEPTFSRLVRAGALAPLDRAKIPNWANQDATLLERVQTSDPENKHGAIYLWGTVGLAIRPDLVKRYAPDAPTDSLDLLLKPENARRLARCGIAIMDSGIDVLPSILRWLGKDPNSGEAGDLRAAEQALLAIRPSVRAITASSNILDSLANGEYCVALTYSGDVIQAAGRAKEAGKGVEIGYIAPKEGAQLWFDMLAIPADAPNPAAAHAFINFVLQPRIMADITNHTHYPNAVPSSRAMVEEEVRYDTNVYPSQVQIERMFTVNALGAAAERARARSWSRFKAGR